jgi:NAD(P)-dependent dehydrogenase (short-subunit alcohol dehydrogenase family)
MKRLEGKAAIVTGAGEGVGRGIARRLASEGVDILVAEVRTDTGERTASEIALDFGVRALFRPTDVAKRDDVLAMVDTAMTTFGRIDVLVNNAWGGGSVTRLEQKTDADMEHGLRVGLFAAFWAMQAAFPHMRDQGGGRIINLCCLSGVNAQMYTAESNSVKEAIRALTRTAAREWARHDILANIICPAAATAAYEALRTASPESAAELLKQNPMGRMGDPERDIGGVAVFLASDDSRYVTGNTLYVDGGSHINGGSWVHELSE